MKSNTELFKKYHSEYDRLANVKDAEVQPWTEFFTLEFHKTSIESFDATKYSDYFDVIYFDAFAPSKQEELWQPSVLSKCAYIIKTGGVLTSYCASGIFKRSLIETGFEISKKPGYGKKRDMIIGIKK